MDDFEKAIKAAGGISALEALIEVPSGNLVNVRKGRRPLRPWMAVRIAELAQSDTTMAAVLALEANSKTENERQTWQRLLHKLKIDNAGKRAR